MLMYDSLGGCSGIIAGPGRTPTWPTIPCVPLLLDHTGASLLIAIVARVFSLNLTPAFVICIQIWFSFMVGEYQGKPTFRMILEKWSRSTAIRCYAQKSVPFLPCLLVLGLDPGSIWICLVFGLKQRANVASCWITDLCKELPISLNTQLTV